MKWIPLTHLNETRAESNPQSFYAVNQALQLLACRMDKLKLCWKKLKEFSNPKNIYGSIFPLIFTLCCCGLVPYKVVGEDLKRTKWCYFIAGINQIMFAYVFVVTIVEDTTFIECFFKTDISKVGNKIHFFVSFASMAIIYTSCFYQRMKLKNVIERLHPIDLRLEKLAFEVEHRQGFRFICVALTVLWILYFLFTFGSLSMIFRYNKNFLMHTWVSYFLPNFMVNLIIFMLVCVLKQIGMRYAGCNKVKLNENGWVLTSCLVF